SCRSTRSTRRRTIASRGSRSTAAACTCRASAPARARRARATSTWRRARRPESGNALPCAAMSKPIRRTCVIGAGVMGSGIAAHFANAGLEVLLLDIVPPNLSPAEKGDRAARNRFSAGGLEKALKARPAAFFHKSAAALVQVGNTEDDLGGVATCDLVIEAVLERLDVKQALFEKLEKLV